MKIKISLAFLSLCCVLTLTSSSRLTQLLSTSANDYLEIGWLAYPSGSLNIYVNGNSEVVTSTVMGTVYRDIPTVTSYGVSGIAAPGYVVDELYIEYRDDIHRILATGEFIEIE